eukprot:2892918-Prymnesium_polylepis.1
MLPPLMTTAPPSRPLPDPSTAPPFCWATEPMIELLATVMLPPLMTTAPPFCWATAVSYTHLRAHETLMNL